MSEHPSPRMALPAGQATDITVAVDPDQVDHNVIALATRLRYFASILGKRSTLGYEPLEREDSEEVLTLLGELVDAKGATEEMIHRVCRALDSAHSHVPARRIARSMGVGVSTAWRTLERARAAGDSEPVEAHSEVVVNGGRYCLPADLDELRRDAPDLISNLATAINVGAVDNDRVEAADD